MSGQHALLYKIFEVTFMKTQKLGAIALLVLSLAGTIGTSKVLAETNCKLPGTGQEYTVYDSEGQPITTLDSGERIYFSNFRIRLK